jgi:Protein of unknown function (DUF1186)
VAAHHIVKEHAKAQTRALTERRSIMSDYLPPVDEFLCLGELGMEVENGSYRALGLRPMHIPDLIRMATDRDLVLSDWEDLEFWAPVHAWQALGELRVEEAVEPLLDILDFVVENDDVNDVPFEVLPEVFAEIGPAAVPALGRFLADSTKHRYARIAVADALQSMEEIHPQTREECVRIFTGILSDGASNEPLLNACIITKLISMNAVEAAPLIDQVLTDDNVESFMTGAMVHVLSELSMGRRPALPELDFFPPYELVQSENDHADPGHSAKKMSKAKARRKLVKKSRKQSRKRR